MKAVIVAAGKSSRLYPRTLELPKTLLPLGNKTILQKNIDSLKKAGVSEIAIVTGYKSQQIVDFVKDECITIYNPFFAHCNNAGSLWFAKDFVGNSPFIYSHADIAYDENILLNNIENAQLRSNDFELIVDFDKELTPESMKVIIDNKGFLIESNKELNISDAHGEWTGLALINNPQKLFSNIENSLKNNYLNNYDTFTFSNMAKQGERFYCCGTEKMNWLEIDFENEYLQAIKLFG
jgi:choline kinase